MPMGKSDWKKRWKHRVKPTRLPGIFKMEEGGHIARARVTDPTTGKMRELKKVLPQSSAEEAFAWVGGGTREGAVGYRAGEATEGALRRLRDFRF
jgi:hypothetical protein